MSRYNALRHGVLTAAPVVPGEDVAAWDQNRQGVLDSLAPVGVLEAALAERVALTLWRLARVARAEALATAADVADALLARPPEDAVFARLDTLGPAIAAARAEEGLAGMRRVCPRIAADGLAALPAWPDGEWVHSDQAEAILHEACEALAGYELTAEPPDVSGDEFIALIGAADPDAWTAGKVRHGLAAVAKSVGVGADWLTAAALKYAQSEVRERTRTWRAARARRAELEERGRVAGDRRAVAALLPPAARADLTLRYEGHLQRMLTTTLHEPERLQAARAGRDVPAPVAVDVTVTGGAGR